MSYLDARDLYTELVDLRDRNEDEDDTLDEDESKRLAALEELAEEIGEDTMRYGETMIPVDEFADYAQELAEETGSLRNSEGNSWPYNHIDWDAAADELSQDYTEVSFDGTDYYVRLG